MRRHNLFTPCVALLFTLGLADQAESRAQDATPSTETTQASDGAEASEPTEAPERAQSSEDGGESVPPSEGEATPASPTAAEAVPASEPLEMRLRLGVNAAFTQSEGVVGQQDGLGVTFGAALTGQLNYRHGAHDWRTGLDYAVAFAYTSVVGQLVKTADRFQVDSVYTWKGLDWLGPYLGLRLETPLIDGDDVRPAPVDYEITELDGDVRRVEQVTRLRLTSPLEPLQLRQSLGASLIALDTPALGLTLKLGLTANEVFAEDALSLADKKETAVVEVTEIDSYIAVGQTSRLEAHGILADNWVAYSAHAELFAPFVDSSAKTSELPLEERLNISFGGKISFRIAAWASIDYEVRALLQPQIQESWQVQNVVLLSFGYDLIE